MFRRLFLAIAAVFMFTASAFAGDPYTVSAVHVEAVADNALEAQTIAIKDGQGLAANLLISRMTLESERVAKGFTGVTPEDGAKMIRALTIANEKRSSTRYLGDITVSFNPVAVGQYMRAKGLTLVATQSRGRLVIPVLEGTEMWSDNEWAAAWQAGTAKNALTPMQAIVPRAGLERLMYNIRSEDISLKDLQTIGQAYGVDQILIATARPGGAGYSVSLKDVALDSGTARTFAATGYTAMDAVNASVAVVENDWKASVMTMDSGQSVMLPVSILYRNQAEWRGLQDVINGSAQIRSAQLVAVSKRGAMMTLTYGGDIERLRNELSYKGVTLKQDEKLGMVLARTGFF